MRTTEAKKRYCS